MSLDDDQLLEILSLLSALGCGLIAGVFFAFSNFVMKALAQRPPGEGIAAMQAINITVINPMFMGAFLGTALLCLFCIGLALWSPPAQGALALWAGSLLYLIGVFGVTMACNVPLNNALAAETPGTEASRTLWRRYLQRWVAWNHLRSAAALAAMAAFMLVR